MPCRRLFVLFVVVALGVSSGAAQQGPPPVVREALRAVETMLASSGEAALTAFATRRLARGYRESFPPGGIEAHLRRLREAVGGSINGLTVEREPDGLRLNVMGATEVAFRLVLDPAGLITKLEQLPAGPAADPTPLGNVTWESLPADLARAEAAGFSGVVLAVRSGTEVLRARYGLADTVARRPTELATIFCIGSTPIDFTTTGILLLAARGKLKLDDPIGRWFANPPPDKRTMTIRHLMTGRSGLPNFHGIDGTDWDHDLAWIDRTTAVRRILGQRLLFRPGSNEAHSHSAFGLLAAVIELASGASYPDFVRREILTPLGMTRTGWYGERGSFAVGDFAVGYGPSAVGLPNIPPNWGPVSWLVQGSGGMYSTLSDMARYYAAVEAGTLVSGELARVQQGPRVDAGGSERGYFIGRATDGRGSSVLFLTNRIGPGAQGEAMLRAFEKLVMRGG